MKVGYAVRKGKTILATDKGVQLIAIMPGEIASPEMTGRWELALDRITDGRQDPAQFMAGIRRFSAFLVDYARNNRAAADFPDDGRRKQRRTRMVSRGTPVEEAVCPLCGKGHVLENARTFFCDQAGEGCRFTLWKDCLTRGGGPELTAKLIQLLLRDKQVRGSTGVIVLDQGQIAFFPTGSQRASAVRPIAYGK